ncbi:hypothetical protein AAHE18_18G242400 [Arachis hypogaea]
MWGASILMQSEEYIGARKKLLSAQKLYPELDNINLMLTICDILLLASIVRLSSDNEIHLDCILDLIYPSATYSDARCYLHDLVTLINGIKDEFPGSELALEIVKNALDMVSDKEKRFHDHHFRKKNDVVSWDEILNGESTESASTLEKDFPNLEIPFEHSLIFKDTNPSDVGEKSLSKCVFSTGQVWAIYCGKDMMPRQYALVNSVISNKHVCVTLLEHELGNFEKRLMGDRFIACGMFKPCDSKVMLNMSHFSHLVNYVNGATRPQQHYMIYPNKGEIWAVYKNWDRNWGNDDYEKCQFGIVEIISDFSKENGIRVAKLEEVHNCVTFFWRQKHEGFDLCFTVFEADMHRFSHQVIAYRVPGIEMYGIPEDSWHLEPQAIPNQ